MSIESSRSSESGVKGFGEVGGTSEVRKRREGSARVNFRNEKRRGSNSRHDNDVVRRREPVHLSEKHVESLFSSASSSLNISLLKKRRREKVVQSRSRDASKKTSKLKLTMLCSRLPPMVSSSSMKMMEGECAFAVAKSFLTF